jgi:hypothetical protein
LIINNLDPKSSKSSVPAAPLPASRSIQGPSRQSCKIGRLPGKDCPALRCDEASPAPRALIFAALGWSSEGRLLARDLHRAICRRSAVDLRAGDRRLVKEPRMQISNVASVSAMMPKMASRLASGISQSAASGDQTASAVTDIVDTQSSGGTQGLSQTADTATDPTQTFLDYMKETPAQQMEDAWLASHHLTRKDLAAMSPDKRQAIEKQMAEEIKQKVKQETEKKSAAKVNILV